jgi:predicted DNA-binding transcriptional regulator AlpA
MNLFTIRELMAYLRVKSRSTIYRWMADSGFPSPIRLGDGYGSAARWRQRDVDEWLSRRSG